MNIQEIAQQTAAVATKILHEQALIVDSSYQFGENRVLVEAVIQNLEELSATFAAVGAFQMAEVATQISEEAGVIAAMIQATRVSLQEGIAQVDSVVQKIEDFMGSLAQLDSGSM